VRAGGRAWASYVLATRERGAVRVSALAILEQKLGLLSYEAHSQAERDLERWRSRGITVVSIASGDYPENLRVVENRPPLLFVRGALDPGDRRAVAVIGTRQPSDTGLALASSTATALARAGFTVVSGLAKGIDAAVHRAVVGLCEGERARRARTLALLGNGVDRVYPPAHAQLQAQVAACGAVVSQFWPESEPTRASFPARNAVMSGMTLGSVIVEASEQSGTRIQARHALAQGRLVVLMAPALACSWARELAERPGVAIAEDDRAVVELFNR